MTVQEFSEYFDKKIEENEQFVRITFYELRIKYNLSQDELEEFLSVAKNRFENLGYEVYFTGENYIYPNVKRIVQDNELMIAIKLKV